MEKFDIIQWATILSPIIAVIIAVVTSWLNSKGVTKQIASIKSLYILHAEIAIIQNEIVTFKNSLLLHQCQETFDEFHFSEESIFAHQLDSQSQLIMAKQRSNKQLEGDLKFYKYLHIKLQEKQRQLVDLKNELEQLK